MNPKMESDVMAALEAGRQEFLSAMDGLTDVQAAMRPAEDRWSALECVEHIVTVEGRFQGWITNGKALETAQANVENEASLFAHVTDRSVKIKAPEVVVPKGSFVSVEAGRAAFNAARDLTVQMASDRGSALYLVGVEHPRLGPMNGIELLYIIAGHARRHSAQIRENRATLGH